MGLFGKGSVDANTFCEAVRQGEDAAAISLLAKIKDITATCKGKRVPFLEACKYGRRRVVIRILKAHDSDLGVLEKKWLSKGLLASCGDVTDRGIVLMLLQRGAAPGPAFPIAEQGRILTRFPPLAHRDEIDGLRAPGWAAFY